MGVVPPESASSAREGALVDGALLGVLSETQEGTKKERLERGEKEIRKRLKQEDLETLYRNR